MKTKGYLAALLVLLISLAALLWANRRSEISESQAPEIARKALQKYCERYGCNAGDFSLKNRRAGPPQNAEDPVADFLWTFEYVAVKGSSRHEVDIMVDRWGGHETSFSDE